MSSVDLSPEERAKIVAARADVKYGPFASLHEAYGVLAEEMDELLEVCPFTLTLNSRAALLAVRKNSATAFSSQCQSLRAHVGSMYRHAAPQLTDAQREEMIDVIAVCDRIIAQWGEKS